MAVLLALTVGFLGESGARIVVEGDTVTFTLEGPKRKERGKRIRKATRFEKEDRYRPEKATKRLPMYPGALDWTEGRRIAVSDDKERAVILEYACTHMVYAADNPWVCDSEAVIVDADGYVLREIRGNYFWVILHNRLPYFALVESFCCDVTGRAELFTLEGAKVCDACLGPDPKTEQEDNRNWTDRSEFTCDGGSLDTTFVLDLQAGRIAGPGGEFVPPKKDLGLPEDEFDRLVVLLRHEKHALRWHGAMALAKRGDGKAIDALIGALRDKDSRVEIVAGNALRQVENPEVIGPLVACLQDEDPSIRLAAIFPLGGHKGPAVLDALLGALKDEDEHIRHRAASELHNHAHPRAIDALIDAMKEEDRGIRFWAVRALGEIRDPRVIEPLVRALADRDTEVRRLAAGLLGDTGDPRAIKPLIDVLGDQSPVVVKYASESLGRLTGQRFGEDAERWGSWWRKNKARFTREGAKGG